jgi:hypothetical protein
MHLICQSGVAESPRLLHDPLSPAPVVKQGAPTNFFCLLYQVSLVDSKLHDHCLTTLLGRIGSQLSVSHCISPTVAQAAPPRRTF